jgi:hypothetical protein
MFPVTIKRLVDEDKALHPAAVTVFDPWQVPTVAVAPACRYIPVLVAALPGDTVPVITSGPVEEETNPYAPPVVVPPVTFPATVTVQAV